MIYPIQMYACKCDGCGQDWMDETAIAYKERDTVQFSLHESGYYTCQDGRTYCPECWSYDDEDNLVFKKSPDTKAGDSHA